jgi:hypothetical protein
MAGRTTPGRLVVIGFEMPLDFCHPMAPHRKLRLPEWYVSSLMMERAKLDRKHDIPYLAGYSLDGKTIYIDRHMPRAFKFRGRAVETDRFLILHEEVEKTLIDQTFVPMTALGGFSCCRTRPRFFSDSPLPYCTAVSK